MKRSLLTLVWASIGALLIAGFYLPLIDIHQLYVFTDQISMMSAIADLLNNGDFGLALIVFVFSIVTPTLKWVIIGIATWNTQHHHPWLATLERTGKWSMLDVFVVALLLVVIKIGAFADAELNWGLYCFASALILEMVLAHYLHRAHAKSTVTD